MNRRTLLKASSAIATVGMTSLAGCGEGDGGDGGGGPQIPDAAKTLGIASVMGMGATVTLAYFFLRFGGDNEG